jgi:hypothetical protein
LALKTKGLFQYKIIDIIKVEYENMLFCKRYQKSRIREYPSVELGKKRQKITLYRHPKG